MTHIVANVVKLHVVSRCTDGYLPVHTAELYNICRGNCAGQASSKCPTERESFTTRGKREVRRFINHNYKQHQSN